MKEMDYYDGAIKVADTVNKSDVVIHFVCERGFRYGKAVRFMPRKRLLVVKVNGFNKLSYVDEEHCIDAFVGPKGDRDRKKVVW